MRRLTYEQDEASLDQSVHSIGMQRGISRPGVEILVKLWHFRGKVRPSLYLGENPG